MDQKKPKSVWWALLAILWALLSPAGCSVPTTYDEMEAARNATTDPEVRADLDERIAKLERDAELASLYFENREACFKVNSLMWFCTSEERYNERRPVEGIDDLVRTYRKDRHNCSCVKRRELDSLF